MNNNPFEIDIDANELPGGILENPLGWDILPFWRFKSPYAVLHRLKPCRLGYWRKTYQLHEVLGVVLNDLLIRHTKTCSEPFANSLAHPERNPS